MTQHYLCFLLFPICVTGACMFWKLTHPSLPACALGLPCCVPALLLPLPLPPTAKSSNRRRLEEVLRTYDQTLKSLQAAEDKVLAQFCFPVGSSYRPQGWAKVGLGFMLYIELPRTGIFVKLRARWPCPMCLIFFFLNKGLERFRQVFENSQPSTDLATLLLLFTHLLSFPSSFLN